MKKIIPFLFVFILFAVNSSSQIPQYYNFNTTGSNNSFPMGIAGGKMLQGLVVAGEFNQPSPAPSGTITKFSIRVNDLYPYNNITYSFIYIRMGQANITTLPTGAFYSGTMDTVFKASNYLINAAGGTWVTFNLTTPFVFNNSEALIFEIGQFGFSGSNFYPACNTTLTGIRRSYSVGGPPFVYSGQGTQMMHCGIDIGSAPVSTNRCLLFPTPGVNTNYITIPHQAGMIGFTSITIEGWVKIGGSTTPNTVLNKGGSSFDYQLGINGTTTNPFFRAGSTIVIANTVTVTPGQWTHLAVTVGAGTIKFYKDGAMVFTQASSPVFGSSTNEMRIGRGGSDPASGNIDEIRLWNVVRTDAEISSEMCNKYVPNNATGLKGKWHFDSTLVDSVNGWNGTVLGNVGYDTVTWCPITGIQQIGSTLPKEYVLAQNYPNPFNPSTTIEFSIPKEGYVEMKLFDITGREVATLVSDPYRAGTYSVSFDASKLASGVYFYKITAGDFTDTKKMVLVK